MKLGNLLGSMDRLPTMVTAAAAGDWLLGEICRKQDGDACARAMLQKGLGKAALVRLLFMRGKGVARKARQRTGQRRTLGRRR